MTSIRIALVGCGKVKRPCVALARALYVSPLVRGTITYCEAEFDQTYVISALHGLVGLDDPLEPYDLTLAQMDQEELSEWGHTVLSQLAETIGDVEAQLHVFAGERYAMPIRWNASEYSNLTVFEPWSGMGIGQRLAWLKRARGDR